MAKSNGFKSLMQSTMPKANSKTGHVKGKMPGNMMGYSKSNDPFDGVHPPKAKLKEVSTQALTSSQAKDPGAAREEASMLKKLEASTPYPAAPVMKDSWTGGSGEVGGKGAKTLGISMPMGQVEKVGKA
jgi:hypothetical protein